MMQKSMQYASLSPGPSRQGPASHTSLGPRIYSTPKVRVAPCQGQRRYSGFGRYGDGRDPTREFLYDPKLWEEGVRTAAQVAELARQFATRTTQTADGFTQSSEKFTQEVKDVPQFLPVDLEEKDCQYHLLADVPGLQKSDLKITVTPSQRSITIRGDRSRVNDIKDVNLKQKFERRMGKFERIVTDLPEDADLTGVAAKVDKGVLTIFVDKVWGDRSSNDEINVEIN